MCSWGSSCLSGMCLWLGLCRRLQCCPGMAAVLPALVILLGSRILPSGALVGYQESLKRLDSCGLWLELRWMWL